MQGNDSPLSSCVKLIAMSTATEERVTQLTGRDVQLPPMHNWTEDTPSTRRLIAYAMVLHFGIAAPNTAQTTRAMNDICDGYSNYPVKSRQLKRRMRLRYCQEPATCNDICDEQSASTVEACASIECRRQPLRRMRLRFCQRHATTFTKRLPPKAHLKRIWQQWPSRRQLCPQRASASEVATCAITNHRPKHETSRGIAREILLLPPMHRWRDSDGKSQVNE